MNEKHTLSKREEQAHRKNLKRMMKVIISSFGVVAIIGLIVWSFAQSSAGDGTPGSRLIARYGIHWHPHLSIVIKGKEIPIPVGIGLMGTVHNPIHTHDPDGIIHMEFDGRVTEKDTELKNFFDLWGKDFSKDSLLGNKSGVGGTVRMFVNGKENFEFEHYHMKNGDAIELKFE